MRTAALLIGLAGCASAPRPTPTARLLPMGSTEQPYVELLGGPPGSVSMESGVVSLSPGNSVGSHDTDDYEEVVIPLEGRGELRVAGRAPIALTPGYAAYTPPRTTHDVANVGETRFRYVFVVARTP